MSLTLGQIFRAHHAESAALRIVGKTRSEWSAFAWEVFASGFTVKIAPFRLLKNGPRKGKPAWAKQPRLTVFVTEAQILAEAEIVEGEGVCANCLGERVVNVGWSASTGPMTATCPRCKGTGKPPCQTLTAILSADAKDITTDQAV